MARQTKQKQRSGGALPRSPSDFRHMKLRMSDICLYITIDYIIICIGMIILSYYCMIDIYDTRNVPTTYYWRVCVFIYIDSYRYFNMQITIIVHVLHWCMSIRYLYRTTAHSKLPTHSAFRLLLSGGGCAWCIPAPTAHGVLVSTQRDIIQCKPGSWVCTVKLNESSSSSSWALCSE